MEVVLSLALLHRSRTHGTPSILLKVYLSLCVGALLVRLVAGLVYP
jgi:hypothetical protein